MRECLLPKKPTPPINPRIRDFLFQNRDQPPAALAAPCRIHCIDGPWCIAVPPASTPAPSHDAPAPLPPKHTRYRDLVLEVPPEILEFTKFNRSDFPEFANTIWGLGSPCQNYTHRNSNLHHPTHTTQIDYKPCDPTHMCCTYKQAMHRLPHA
jgi:hypothetical protein